MSGLEACWRLVYGWLGIAEVASLRSAAHCMDFLAAEDIFSAAALEQIAPLQLSNTAAALSETACGAWVTLCRELLDIPSCKALVQAFNNFTLPLVGYWRKVATTASYDEDDGCLLPMSVFVGMLVKHSPVWGETRWFVVNELSHACFAVVASVVAVNWNGADPGRLSIRLPRRIASNSAFT